MSPERTQAPRRRHPELDYRSARDRLEKLPQILTPQVVAEGLSVAGPTARTYLHRWTASGVVRSLGPRAGVYVNTIRSGPVPEHHLLGLALRQIVSSPVAMGTEVLLRAGWITQLPTRIDVAVPFRRTYPKLDDVQLCMRSADWFDLAQSFLNQKEMLMGLRSVTPAFALADALVHGRHQDVWRPHPDDLYAPDTKADKADFLRAMSYLEPGFAELVDTEADFEDIYESAFEAIKPRAAKDTAMHKAPPKRAAGGDQLDLVFS